MSGSQTSRSSSVDLPTLLVTAIASAAAAYVTSKLWTPGTLGAAAFTPVLIALLKEALYKPAEVVTRAVPVRGVVRSTSSSGQPEQPAPAQSTEVAEQRVPQPGEAPGRSQPRRGRSWKVAIVTGLLGFVLAALIITVPELVAGGSASGGGRETTFFGGGGAADDPADTTTTPASEDGEEDGGSPAPTVTVPDAETITVPPAETTPVPEEGTPAPPEEESPEVPATPPAPPG